MNAQIPHLPPQPKELQISQAMHCGYNLWENMTKYKNQFGDAFTTKFPGQGPMVWVSHPDMVKDVFSLKPDQYDASQVQIPVDVGEKNTVFLNTKEHEHSRKIVIPPLNTNRLRERASVMHDIVTEHINSWVPGDRYNIPRLVGDITLDIICYTVFNLRHGPRKEKYKKLMLGFLLSGCSDAMFAIGSLFGALRVRQILNKQYLKRTAVKDFGDGEKGILPWKQPIELKVQLADMIRTDLRDIRRRNDPTETHMLATIAKATYDNGELMDEERVIAETVGLLLGGHETSAATSAWFMLWLMKKPDVMEKIRNEVKDSIAKEGKFDPVKIAELPYLTACLNESQRLTPSAIATIRWLTQDTKIGPLYLPKGCAVLPNTYLTHRRKDIYGEDAEEYRPERWLEGNKFGPNEFFPFGGGRRACIGMNQARQQLRIIFAEFARRAVFESEWENNNKWPIPRMIGGQTEPDGGVWVTVKDVRPENADYPATNNKNANLVAFPS